MDAVRHTDLLSPAWPTALVFLAAGLAVAIWVASHFASRLLPGRLLAGIAFVVRAAIGSFALWLVCSALDRVIVLQTSWSIPAICVLIALAVEIVVWLYRRERDFVTPRKGLVLTALRAGLLLVLGSMLLQPEFAWTLSHRHERYVAILLDDSESMRISDAQLTVSEKLRLVRAFDPKLAEPPYDLGSVASELDREADRLGAAAEQLSAMRSVSAEAGESEFQLSQASLAKTLQEAQRTAQRQAERIDDLLRVDLKLNGEVLQGFQSEKRRLETDVVGRLAEADRALAERAGDPSVDLSPLVDAFNGAAASAREVAAKLPALIDDVDRAYFASLPPETAQKIDALVSRTRAEIARAVLIAQGRPEAAGLLEKIREGYEVRLFRFDGECAEIDPAEWSSDAPPTTLVAHQPGAAPGAPATISTVVPAGADADSPRRLTDLAGALETARKEIPRADLAGVLLVTDGRDTAASDVDAAVAKLAADGVPVSALAIGSSRPPVNASIVDLDLPETVMVDDAMSVEARIKLTGMQGRTVRATLLEGDEVLAERTLEVGHDDFATSVRLEHAPQSEGMKQYRVALEPVGADATEREAFADDNERAFSVAVSDDRTEILMLEGRPRWEFNYLRNLFAGRDVHIELQTVLFEPDRLEGQSDPPRVHAAVSREAHQVEATHPPENEAEWLKFDVIILGDVGREHLTDDMQRILHRFVHERGGALMVIAGPKAMPHRHVETPLGEMLPFEFAESQDVQFESPEEAFRIRLTPSGVRHAITRQADTSDASLAIWSEVPDLYWRHALLGARPGATVLAYAGDEAKEKEFEPRPADPPEAADARRVLREAFQRERALIGIQNFGSGRVMMLNTDRTWRLRYRVGDERHHRFWGQAVRWAAGEKLQAGTQFVQLGADRARYEPGQPVQVTAKLSDAYFEPIVDDKATVKVFRGEELALTVPLSPIPEAPGSFRADLGPMPQSGSYRIALDSPEVRRVFAGEAEESVETVIAVETPQSVARELIDPTADRPALNRIAAKARGVVVEADDAERVLEYFAEGTETFTETRSIALWDGWPLLVLLVSLVSVEWIVRKTGGLV